MNDLNFDLHMHLTKTKDTSLNATISIDFVDNTEDMILTVITHYGTYWTKVHNYKELNEELGRILTNTVQDMLN